MAADEQGIVDELLHLGSDQLLAILAEIFTAALRPQTAVPEYRKASSIRVLLKKGDPRLPENYRPICIIPVFYKLFTRVLCARVEPTTIGSSVARPGRLQTGIQL